MDGGAVDRPWSRTPCDLLEEQAWRRGDHPAVVHSAGTASYAELQQRAVDVSGALAAAGVGLGDRVGLLVTNRVEWLECYFGTTRLGATVHAFNTWVTARELDHLLGEADCSVLVLLERYGRRRYLDDLRDLVPEVWEADAGEWTSSRYPSLRQVVVVGGPAPRGAVEYRQWVDAGSTAGAVRAHEGLVPATGRGVVLYTSGSTARPKAVPLLSHGMVENGFHIGERMRLTPSDRVWLSSPLFWSFGCANALMATFGHGATLVLQEQFQPEAAVDLVESEACTAAYLLPTLTRAIVASDGFDARRLASLRTGLTIGTPDDVRLAAEQMGVEGVCNIYGSTETYGNCCVTPTDAPLADRLVSQGPPLPGVEVRTVDAASREPTARGAVGEIEVRGYLTPGYLGTSGAGADPFTSDGYYRTGDLGWLDERGWLHYTARATDMIKTAGINVAPAEVEEFLLTLAGVAQVAVVGVPDEARGEVVVAYLVPEPGHELDEAEVVAECRAGMASYKVPARVVIALELPKTGTGKLHRVRLREMAVQQSTASAS